MKSIDKCMAEFVLKVEPELFRSELAHGLGELCQFPYVWKPSKKEKFQQVLVRVISG